MKQTRNDNSYSGAGMCKRTQDLEKHADHTYMSKPDTEKVGRRESRNGEWCQETGNKG